MITVNSREELKELIKQRIEEQGPKCDLNDIDVSRVKDMHGLFFYSSFDGDISGWDVSNVEDMSYMFSGSKFSGNLSKWDVSKAKTKFCMFFGSPLDGGNEPEWYK